MWVKEILRAKQKDFSKSGKFVEGFDKSRMEWDFFWLMMMNKERLWNSRISNEKC
jgi:hypothetical protein